MCGIWASIGLDVTRERITRVAHRGPDGEGWRTFESPQGPVCLGHRRLSIIDTSDAGLQPMADPSERYWLVFNGEIYNYVEVRAELAAMGVAFRTQSDSEVLLHALIVWGEDALQRLLGMFAFALWDDQQKSMLVARDRFGIKPLYYAALPHGIAFASEIKQLHDLPGLPRRMNLARVYDFLGQGILDHTAETMFAGIKQLRGGDVLRVSAARSGDMPRPQVKSWYRLPKPGSLTLSLDEAARRFRQLFDDSIRLHLRSDVPLGSCLSGGLDSSSIVGVASRQLGRDHPMTTISATFPVPRVDERRYMDAVIRDTGARGRFVTFEPNRIFELADTLLWHQDEPFGSTSIHAQWSVFGGAQDAGLKVMLDGQGADEPLAGYHSLFGPALAELIRTLRWSSAVRMLRERQGIHAVGLQHQMMRAAPYLMPAALRAIGQKQVRAAGGADWLAGSAMTPFQSMPGPVETAAAELGLGSPPDLGGFCAVQTMATSVPMLLHWEDRSSMAHGIEARVPFLDHRLVELAISLGGAHKIEGARTKVLLRTALADALPPEVRERNDKLGFASPEEEWFCGPLKDDVRRAVVRTLDLYPSLLNRDATLGMTDAILSGRRRFDFSLWRIACVGLWGQRFGLAA